MPLIEWLGVVSNSAGDLINTSHELGPKLREAIRFLFESLVEDPQRAKDCVDRAREAGICKRTLERAKDLLHVESVRDRFGPDAEYYWVIPHDDPVVRRLWAEELACLWQNLVTGSTAPLGPAKLEALQEM